METRGLPRQPVKGHSSRFAFLPVFRYSFWYLCPPFFILVFLCPHGSASSFTSLPFVVSFGYGRPTLLFFRVSSLRFAVSTGAICFSFVPSLSLFLSFLLFCTSLPFSIRPSSDNEKPSLRSKRETIGNATTIIARDFAFIAIKSRSERGWILISSLCSDTLFFYLCGSIEKIALAFPSSVALLTLDITNLGFSHDQTHGSSCPAFSNSFSKYRSSSSTSIKMSDVRDNLFVAIIRWLW